jgi:hypothetical protein
MDGRMRWKPLAWVIGFTILLLAGWGIFKVVISDHAVKDAKLEKDYQNQKDSTKAWRESYKAVEDARKNLQDTLSILSGLVAKTHAETTKWHDSATAAKARLILIPRPAETDSTNPKWMHRAIQLETTVASQDREIAGKDAEIALSNTKQKLLLSQMSKDSISLYSANSNIDRLNKLVEGFKDKADCKVAWVLPCLSRTQSFVVGGIAGATAAVLVNTFLKK